MSAPRWDVEGRDWPSRAHSRFVDVGRIRWHVQVMGEGPVVLLVHGTGAATHSWRDIAPILAQHFTVIAPDLPGHGFTTGRPVGGMSMASMARALADLVATLDMPPRLIIGHSAGAAIALRMVGDDLVQPSALIGLNAAVLPFPGLAARIFPTLAKLLFVNPFAPTIFSRIARTPGEVGSFLPRATGSRIDAAGVDYYARLFATSGHCSGAITMMAEWDLPSLKAILSKVTVPVLLLHGAKDAAIPPRDAEAAATLMRDAEARLLPDLGHLAHEEQPEMVAALIVDFARAQGILTGEVQ